MIFPIIKGWKFTWKTKKFSCHEVLHIDEDMTTINYILNRLLALFGNRIEKCEKKMVKRKWKEDGRGKKNVLYGKCLVEGT